LVLAERATAGGDGCRFRTLFATALTDRDRVDFGHVIGIWRDLVLVGARADSVVAQILE
jgi:hypothetical protein